MKKYILLLISLGLMLTGCSSASSSPDAAIPPAHTKTVQPTPMQQATAVPYYDKPGQYLEILTINGETRWFAIYIPQSYQHGTPAPLVLNFHGAGSNYQEQAIISGMDALAEADGFIIVYPQADNGGQKTWQLAIDSSGSADIEFTQAIIAHMKNKLTIDNARIYATGLSNGGGFVDNIGCYLADTFAAIAPVAGAYVYWISCEPNAPVSMLAIHGDVDAIAPYAGGGYSTPAWAATWAERNGCHSTALITQLANDISLQSWEDCAQGSAVALYTIAGGGHFWPGSPVYAGSPGATENLDASTIIWEFFKTHPKP